MSWSVWRLSLGGECKIREAAHQLLESVIPSTRQIRLVYQGSCMVPVLKEGDILIVLPGHQTSYSLGDIVAYRSQTTENEPCNLVHRFMFTIRSKGRSLVFAKADNFSCFDSPFDPELVIGKVVEVRRGEQRISFTDRHSTRIRFLFGFISAWQGLIYLLASQICSRTVGTSRVPVWIKQPFLRFISLPLRVCRTTIVGLWPIATYAVRLLYLESCG